MKISRVVWFAALSLFWQAAPQAQSQSAPGPAATHPAPARESASAFEPFDRWKAAILAGNRTRLAALYSLTPPSQSQTPQAKSQDPGEEPAFWSAFAAQGLSEFQPKILSIERPQTGEVALVLRVEFNLKTSSGVQPFTVEGAQVWIQQGRDWRIAMTQRGDLEPSPTFRLPVPAKPNTSLYPPPEVARSEVAAALASAAKDRKRVLLVFGANWCYDCHVLDATFHSKAFASLVNANFHVVHINVGDEGDKNLDLAESYGVPLKKAVRIPSLAVLDPDGRVLYSQKNGEFDDSVRLGPADVAEFLSKWKPFS
ncbi:MAG TPA: thioredoxin family protein [Candidatus Acidoferrales bacterium]|nr:thioredoxin family protein [Candidatus Acidoferrales bacterium]